MHVMYDGKGGVAVSFSPDERGELARLVGDLDSGVPITRKLWMLTQTMLENGDNDGYNEEFAYLGGEVVRSHDVTGNTGYPDYNRVARVAITGYYPQDKVKAIKIMRSLHHGMDLRNAKELVDNGTRGHDYVLNIFYDDGRGCQANFERMLREMDEAKIEYELEYK